VARALLDHAARWLTGAGANVLRGPIDLSTNYRTGLLIEGDPGPPGMMMPHNPPHYAAWLEGCGLAKARDVLSLDVTTTTIDQARLRRLGTAVAARARITLRPIAMRRFTAEIAEIWRLYTTIWERNWGFVPMARGEFEREARGFKSICVPELIWFALAGDEPIGFIVGLPDVTEAILTCRGRLLPLGWWHLLRARSRTRRLRLLTLGVSPQHRGRGIDAALIHAVVVAGIEHGIHSAECGWVLEDNEAMLKPLAGIGARPFRRYRIYERPLGER
jgi:ribosomal protein S18 acetylase RimI-like enzyme